jgi:formylglycine-generating enzyme required for sulfatase activity
MRNGQVPGKRWKATDGTYNFKLTIHDETGFELEKLLGLLEKLPAPYMRACEAVSDEGEDGIAVYADLGGAAAHGGQSYINIVPRANTLVIAHEAGHTLEQVARSKDAKILEKWADAIAKDKISVSDYGDRVCHEDLGEFAQVYAVCLAAGPAALTELRKLSPTRFALWERMLKEPEQKAETPAGTEDSKAQRAAADRLGIPATFTNDAGMAFVLIPAGRFLMGSGNPAIEVARHCNMPNAQQGWFVDEHPCHEVTIKSAFYMSVHEVTHAAYEAVMQAGAGRKKSRELEACPEEFRGPDKPIVFVSWSDAEQFCKTLGKQDTESGRTYSLPTEAQWEYACRAGTGTPFSFGETLSTAQANYDGGYTYDDGRKGATRGGTMPVGSFPANTWGLHDMHGNVSEWCADWYAPYGPSHVSDPRGPDKSDPPNQRVVRGGAWRSYPGACRSACRLRGSVNGRLNHIGFRVCCSLPGTPEEGE